MKMAILAKEIHRVKITHIKIPIQFHTEIEKMLSNTENSYGNKQKQNQNSCSISFTGQFDTGESFGKMELQLSKYPH